MKNILFLICLLILFFSGSTNAEQKILLASTNWEPYAADSMKNQGFTAEIIREAFKRSGYEVKMSFLPWKRAIFEAEKGKFDGVFSAYFSDERAQKFTISEPYISSPVMLCVRNDFGKNNYTSLREFSDMTFGVVRGYVNSPEIDSADYIKKDEAVDDAMNMVKLIKKRIDIIVIDKYVALQELQKLSKTNEYEGKIKFLEPPLEIKPVHILFPKINENNMKLKKDFDSGLKAIKSDGTMEKILRRYDFYGK